MEEPRPTFSTLLYGWLQKAEKFLLAGAVLALILRYTGYPVDQLLTISLSGLAMVYFLSAFSPPKPVETEGDERKSGFIDLFFGTTLPKLAGIGSAVAIIGVLFALQHLNGYTEMLNLGLLASGGVSVLIVIGLAMGNERAKLLTPTLYRLVPLAIISAFFLYRP